MLHPHFIVENKNKVIEGLKKRQWPDAEKKIIEIIENDRLRRETQKEHDDTQAKANVLAKSIGELIQEGKKEEAERSKSATKELKLKISDLKEQLHHYEEKLHQLLLNLPNVPHVEVPEGNSSEANLIVDEKNNFVEFTFPVKPHWDLIKELDIIDFELGSKITGSGFPVYKGKGAKLQRALIHFFLNEAEKEGYLEVQPPILINKDSGIGTGQLPDKDGQMYHVNVDDLYLIPTAEVPITNMFRDVILSDQDFPLKLVGYTPCFRREAGSWGANVRGLNRLHQFDKVEIVQIQHPDRSYKALEEMRTYIESLLQKLELPYRVLKLCGGDLGFTSAFTYDLEVFSGAQKKWLEVSSVSNFETYQSNRLKLRYKDGAGKTNLAHTLNGSALALPRILAALIENNQSPDGIKIPKVLQSYTGFDFIG